MERLSTVPCPGPGFWFLAYILGPRNLDLRCPSCWAFGGSLPFCLFPGRCPSSRTLTLLVSSSVVEWWSGGTFDFLAVLPRRPAPSPARSPVALPQTVARYYPLSVGLPFPPPPPPHDCQPPFVRQSSKSERRFRAKDTGDRRQETGDRTDPALPAARYLLSALSKLGR